MFRGNGTWCWALGLLVALMVAGCGGGSTTDGNVNPGSSNPPGVVLHNGGGSGDGSGGGSGGQATDNQLSRYFTAQPITGATENAPLGTNPAYNVHEITPEVSGMSASRAASSVTEFTLLDVTVAKDGDEPNWNADPSSLKFREGTKVRFWVLFDAPQATTMVCEFKVDAINLDYSSTVDIAAGQQAWSYLYQIPFMPGNNDTPAVFYCSFSNRTSSVVAIGDYSLVAPFTIVNVAEVRLEPKSWEIVWQKQLVNSDYDYNDLVVRLSAQEILDPTSAKEVANMKVMEVVMYAKALARGDGYSGDWEFNLENAFPQANSVISTTQQYKAGGLIPDGETHTWTSEQGICIPVFTPVKNVIPSPPGGNSEVNVWKNQQFINGGIVKIRIFPTPYMDQNSYQALPYTNQMLVLDQSRSNVYIISLSTNRGGNKVAGDPNPIGFILPPPLPGMSPAYTNIKYAWPLEGRDIRYTYSMFDTWLEWWSLQPGDDGYNDPEPRWWEQAPNLIQGMTGTSNCYQPQYFLGGLPLAIDDIDLHLPFDQF